MSLDIPQRASEAGAKAATMTAADALTLLSHGDRLFFASYADRCVYARLVMTGDARCYVREDRTEWVRLATDEERAIHARNSACAENVGAR